MFANTASNNRIELYSVYMAQQLVNYDCGLFAIAYAVELCLNNNPTDVEFDKSTMWAHYNMSLANSRFTVFQQNTWETVLYYQLHCFKGKWIMNSSMKQDHNFLMYFLISFSFCQYSFSSVKYFFFIEN